MMKHSILSAVTAFAVAAGCHKSAPAPGSLNCTQLANDKDQVSVCLQKVVEDSRCPVNTQCIWAGVAVAQFSFTKNGEQQLITLSTTNVGANRKDTTIQGYKVEFVNLYPYPGSSNPAAPQAEIKITKL